ncbi:hypothetical protein HY933_01000 [Candidatus Falkowbacteria bacterium]|nr:hypothetical protein [Candidatus Falkowbacteria bacterium]
MIWLVVIVVVVGLGGWGIWRSVQPGELDSFAQCITDSDAVFYGAFWCPHCQNQKNLFGKSERLLPYVECSTPDGRSMIPSCQEQGVEGYPTWSFADGSKLGGLVELETLAEKTGCALP